MAIFSRKNFQQDDNDYAKTSRYYVEDEVEVEEEESVPANNVGFGGVSLGGSSIELKVVRPEHFEDVSTIADHLLSGRTVVLNLEAASKETARRLLDFLSGIAYSIDGQMKRVANNTYIITPNNVDVSDSAMRGERGGADID